MFLGVASVTLVVLSIAGYVLASSWFPHPGYKINSREVLWYSHVVADADPATFKWLSDEAGMDQPWGRDANYGYFRDLRIEDSHGPSFVAIDNLTAKDRDKVYRGERLKKGGGHPQAFTRTTQQADRVWTIRGADAGTFRREGSGYIDRNHRYLRSGRRSFETEANDNQQK